MVIGRSFHGSGNWHNAQVIRRLLLLALLLTCTARRQRGCADCDDRDIPDVFHRGGSTGAREQMGTGPEARGEDQPAGRHARGPWGPCARAARRPAPTRATDRSDLRRGVLRSVAFNSSALFSLPAGSTGGTRIMRLAMAPHPQPAAHAALHLRMLGNGIRTPSYFYEPQQRSHVFVSCVHSFCQRGPLAFFFAPKLCDDPRRRSTVLFNETKAGGVARREKKGPRARDRSEKGFVFASDGQTKYA